ncbi:glycosyl transferase family 1 [Lasius niger]|uniref:Glycosyl transferase family 1 n=1 Tax=Lasius niger TaxID=67767 RepID=A0A0J7K053_LASNI|nr:glycosyl transferase family 1 [Lasius niger]
MIDVTPRSDPNDANMKIHYLVTSLETGGAEFAIPDIARTLQRLGHQVKITACEPRDRVAATRLDEAGLPYEILCRRRRSWPSTLAAFLVRILADKPDVIWTSLSWATRIGQLAGLITHIPVVSFKHSASVRRYTYRMKDMSRLWIADSHTVVTFLHEKVHIPAAQVLAWPLFRCNPEAPEAACWDGQSTLQLGSVGRLHEVKNYAPLLEALAAFLERHPALASRIHLTILGDGPLRAELESTIDRLGLKETVSLPGFSAEVAAFLAGLHVYVQPSRYEGMCIAAHEAMNAGLPILATPVGELKNCVIDGQTGFILEGDLSSALGSALERIFAQPALLQQYGRAARNDILEKFRDEAYTRAAATILDRISGLKR